MKSLKKNIYIFRPYKKDFTKYYSFEKRKLQAILPHAKIEHIGSTAVPGLGGKGIVDIIVSVPKKSLLQAYKKLERLYAYDAGGGSDERYFFQTDYVRGKKTRYVHLHLTFHASKEWHQALAFRDALRKNPAIQKTYAALKRRACRIAKGDGLTYRKYKNPFIRSVLNSFS